MTMNVVFIHCDAVLRLSESNMKSIVSQLEQLYIENSRNGLPMSV